MQIIRREPSRVLMLQKFQLSAHHLAGKALHGKMKGRVVVFNRGDFLPHADLSCKFLADFTLADYSFQCIFLAFLWIFVFFEQPLYQHTHMSPGRVFLLPVYCFVFTEGFCEFFCKCYQVFVGIEISYSFWFCKCIIEGKFFICKTEEISYKVLLYNHHSLKGNIEEKRKVLEKLALHLEPRQTELQELNPTLKKDIFYAFNNLNIRHNNLDETDAGNFNQKFSDFTDEEKEKLYDYVYNYCLEAFLELENKEGRRIIKDLKQL